MKKAEKSRAPALPAPSEKRPSESVALAGLRPAAALPKKKSRGRKKERTQISVRIDQAVMDLAYRTIERRSAEHIRITDLLERGLILALREIEVLDPIYSQARLVLNREGVVFCRRILKVSALMHMPKVRELKPLERAYRDFFLAGIDSVETWPEYLRALEVAGEASHDDSA